MTEPKFICKKCGDLIEQPFVMAHGSAEGTNAGDLYHLECWPGTCPGLLHYSIPVTEMKQMVFELAQRVF